MSETPKANPSSATRQLVTGAGHFTSLSHRVCTRRSQVGLSVCQVQLFRILAEEQRCWPFLLFLENYNKHMAP